MPDHRKKVQARGLRGHPFPRLSALLLCVCLGSFPFENVSAQAEDTEAYDSLMRNFSQSIIKKDLKRLADWGATHSSIVLMINDEKEVFEATKRAASDWENPSLRLGYSRDTNVLESHRDFDAAMRVYVLNPWVKKGRRLQADALTEHAALRTEFAKRFMVVEIKRLYHSIQFNMENIRLLKYLEAMSLDYLDLAKVLVAKNEFTINMQMKAEVEHIEARVQSQLVSREKDLFLRELALLIGYEEGAGLEFEGHAIDPQVIISNYSLSDLQASARVHRIEPKLSMQMAAFSKGALHEAKATEKPWFDHVQLGYGVEDDFGRADSIGAQVAISVPLFSPFNHTPNIHRTAMRGYSRQTADAYRMIDEDVRRGYVDANEQYNELISFGHETIELRDRLMIELESHQELQGLDPEEDYELRKSLLMIDISLTTMWHNYIMDVLQLEAALGFDL